MQTHERYESAMQAVPLGTRGRRMESVVGCVQERCRKSTCSVARHITSVEQKEKFKGEEQLVSHAREYVAKVKGELQKIRDGILCTHGQGTHPIAWALMNRRCFYYKMKGGTMPRSQQTRQRKNKAGEDACVAYAEATKIAEEDLAVTPSRPFVLGTE